ncbi:MAG: thiamine phosphate synthase [Prevotella fusca]|uniref:thiamine phosphate synthase n=1 Tax=Prevotella fusca TaxID=589436 RepID=UPI003F9F61E1
MKLVIMTKSTFFVEEDKILSMLFEEGLDSLHISKADMSPLYLERLLSLLPSEYHRKITVHQHFYTKEEFSLGGIHLDGSNVAAPHGYRGVLSRTCDDVMQLKAMKKQSDYVFLKNIHQPRETSAEEERVLSDLELEEACRQGLLGRYVYAMGGVTLDDIPILRELDFGGVVVRNDLWGKFCIHSEQNFAPIIDHFRKLRALC